MPSTWRGRGSRRVARFPSPRLRLVSVRERASPSSWLIPQLQEETRLRVRGFLERSSPDFSRRGRRRAALRRPPFFSPSAKSRSPFSTSSGDTSPDDNNDPPRRLIRPAVWLYRAHRASIRSFRLMACGGQAVRRADPLPQSDLPSGRCPWKSNREPAS